MAGRHSEFDDDDDGFEPRNDLLDIIPDRLSEDAPLEDEPRRGRSILMGTALVGIAVAGAAAWFLFTGNSGSGTDGPVAAPTIPADANPYKIRPANPGGMQVPNQDKTVYERLDPGASETQAAGNAGERLLPEPPLPVAPSATLPPQREPSLLSIPPETTPQEADNQSPPPAPTLGSGEMPSLGLTKPSGLAKAEEQQQAATVPTKPVTAPVPAKPAEVKPAPVKPAEPVVAAPAPAPVAPKASEPAAPAAGGSYTIQLAALRDEDSARKMWQQMQTKYPSYLGGLSLVIEKADLGQKGVFYRVRGTGLPSEARAREVCAALSKDKVGCLFVGK